MTAIILMHLLNDITYRISRDEYVSAEEWVIYEMYGGSNNEMVKD